MFFELQCLFCALLCVVPQQSRFLFKEDPVPSILFFFVAFSNAHSAS